MKSANGIFALFMYKEGSVLGEVGEIPHWESFNCHEFRFYWGVIYFSFRSISRKLLSSNIRL